MEQFTHQCLLYNETTAPGPGLTIYPIAGGWSRFALLYEDVCAIKEVTQDVTSELLNCTQVFTYQKMVYIIDTPYEVFLEAWTEFLNYDDSYFHPDDEDDDEREANL